MVLNGTMEVYAPYANFSFYAQTDMLRMIDYNISPSFVLTQKPSYLLGSTTSYKSVIHCAVLDRKSVV